MLKKVSDNIINLLKHFNYESLNEETYYEFIFSKLQPAISGLVEELEINPNESDEKLLNNLEDAVDELYDNAVEDIDLDDINKRLKKCRSDHARQKSRSG